MKNIKVTCATYEPKALYQKAKSKNQRALLGYMVKAGYARDPIYGGAFRLVTEVERCAGLYYLETSEIPKVAGEIIRITESAMAGLWDELAFSEREINHILYQLDTLQGKGGK